MTLILGIVCTDGLVLGADSASSDMEAGTKQSSIKIRRIGEHPMLWGASGDVGMIQSIGHGLVDLKFQKNAFKTRKELKRLICPILDENYKMHIPVKQPGFYEPPIAISLFGFIQDRKPFLIEIERDGRDTCYGPELGDFYAIGSGKPLAQAIFRPHINTPRNLELGKIFACRVIEDAINIASSGLSLPVRMYTINLDGIIKEIEELELAEISKTCEMWRELERDSVGTLLAKMNSNCKVDEPELPEPNVPDLRSSL